MVKCLSLTEQYSLWVHFQWCFGWLLPILPLSCRSVHRIHAADQSQTAPKASIVASNLPNASSFLCWRVDGAQTSLGCLHLLPCSPGIEKNMSSANTGMYTNEVFKAVPKKDTKTITLITCRAHLITQSQTITKMLCDKCIVLKHREGRLTYVKHKSTQHLK